VCEYVVDGPFDAHAHELWRAGAFATQSRASMLVARTLDPQPGERVLDIGCGRGAALFPLVERVGGAGHVTGIDLAPGMIAATSHDVASRGLENVSLQVMDAAAPALPEAAYDVVASSLVLFFLPDPAAALVAWRSLLVPGGRLGLATFVPPDPKWKALDAVFRPYLPQHVLAARTSGAAGPFDTDEGVAGLMRAAGFAEVMTIRSEVSVVFTDADQWHAFSWSHGQRVMWESVPEAERETVQAQAYQVLDAGRDDDGALRLTQGIRYTLGHV